MTVTLDQAKAECLSLSPLPDGYRIEADSKTDNLVVYGKELSFCVTRKAIDGGYIKTHFAPSLNALIEHEATSKDGPLQLPPIVHANP